MGSLHAYVRLMEEAKGCMPHDIVAQDGSAEGQEGHREIHQALYMVVCSALGMSSLVIVSQECETQESAPRTSWLEDDAWLNDVVWQGWEATSSKACSASHCVILKRPKSYGHGVEVCHEPHVHMLSRQYAIAMLESPAARYLSKACH